jgi:hypothetical protein
VKVLFLDIDGVLNSTKYAEWRYAEFKSGRVKNLDIILGLDGKALFALSCLLESIPDLKVVISSQWIPFHGIEYTHSAFRAEKWPHMDRFIGVTHSSDTRNFDSEHPRGIEIQRWLDSHPEVTRFAILDDESDMRHLTPFLFKTNQADGLTSAIVQQLIAYYKAPIEVSI